MKYITTLLLLVLIFPVGCSEKTDEELLERDKDALEESLDSYKVNTYKFAKISIRASVEKDTISSEFQSFKKDLDRISNQLVKYNTNAENLSVLDYISMYRDYKRMEAFISKTDEDTFPTLIDAFNVIHGDSTSETREYYVGEEKEYVQNIEHAVLSAIVILSRDLGKEVALYECSKTQPTLLPDSEIKTLLQFFRGFLFFEKGFYYLSEDETSRNIDWLNNNKNIDLPYTRVFFQWGNLDQKQTHTGFHALNHLFRGCDRLMMEREIDEERALQDFEAFLQDANKIGIDNEIVWAIETYLYLKYEENDKAATALAKLKQSSLLSSDEKEVIDESIEYLKNREAGKVLNGVYDKYFLGKIVTKYILSILSKVDWKKVLKDQNIPHVDEIFETIESLENFVEGLEKYSSTDNLKEVGEEIKNKQEGLWEKAKELVE
ncbi:MAG: hypothetical protein ACFB0B_19290 [Thermonemataceae bacterium]